MHACILEGRRSVDVSLGTDEDSAHEPSSVTVNSGETTDVTIILEPK
jgi:hypothetical protein